MWSSFLEKSVEIFTAVRQCNGLYHFLKTQIHLAKLILNETDPETFEILNAEDKIKLSLLGVLKKFVLKRDLLIDEVV